MKTKLLIAAALCLIASVIIVSGRLVSGAWFTDTAISPGSIITTGTLDLSVTGEPLKATDLEPGKDYVSMGVFCNKNTGTAELKFRGLFEPYAPATNDLLSYSTLKVELQTEDGWTTLKEISGRSEDDPLVDYFKFPDQAIWVVNQYIVAGTLSPEQELCYRLSVKLDAATPNELQNKGLDFVLHLQATQTDNPGWD